MRSPRVARAALAHRSCRASRGLTSSIAHELNQPLTAILSNAQAGLQFLAGSDPDIEEIREILQDIVRDDKRAGSVISGAARHGSASGLGTLQDPIGGYPRGSPGAAV